MDSQQGLFTSCTILLLIYASVINCAVKDVSAESLNRNIRQSNGNISNETLDSALSISLPTKSIIKPEPLPTPIAQKQPAATSLDNSTSDKGGVVTQKSSDSYNKPPIVALDGTSIDKVNNEKLKSEKINPDLEPTNSGEHAVHTEQKVTKKQLKNDIKNGI